MTHTFAVLDITKAAFEEIRAKLAAAGYDDQMWEEDGALLIDMHGIGLRAES